MINDEQYNCPKCASMGVTSVIKMIEVPRSGPFRFCSAPNCTYPLDLPDDCVVLENGPNEVEIVDVIPVDSVSSVSVDNCNIVEVNAEKDEETAEIIVDLSLEHEEVVSDDTKDDSSVVTALEEGYEVFRKVLNMCVSDDEEPSVEDTCLSSSTSENDSMTCLSEALPIFPQWRNRSSMCWLDSTLSLLLMSSLRPAVLKVSKENSDSPASKKSKSFKLDSLLRDTYKDYQKVIRRVERLQSRVNSPELSVEAKLCYRRMKLRLERIRIRMFRYLQDEFNIGFDTSGDSPVFALSALLNRISFIRPLFDSVINYHLQCSTCDFQCALSRENPIVCLVRRPAPDFHFESDGFVVRNESCENCLLGEQTRRIHWSRLNRFLLVQFCQGLSESRSVDDWLTRLTFEVESSENQAVRYLPIGIIQYKTLPSKANHFVSWICSPERKCILSGDLGDENLVRMRLFSFEVN